MNSGEIATIIVLVVLVGLSAYFSASETAFSALNRIRMKTLAEGGNKRAALALRLSEDYSTLLSTILVGNNIVNIAATSIATVLFVGLLGGNAGPTVSTIVMTVVVLIFGEISPKTLAKESPERFAIWSAPILRVFSVILKPVNFLFAAWKKLLGKLFKGGGAQGITEEELLVMVDEAEQGGAIEEEDKDLIRNVIEFNDCKVGEILTPRVDVEALPADADPETVTDLFLDTGYTRIPVYEGSVDHITGVLHLRDWFEARRKGLTGLSELLTRVEFITPYTKISDLLKIFQAGKSQMAVVMDEYGGTVGVVTMEDVLEELVGEIWDEHDEIKEQLVQLDPRTWRVAGNADVDDIFEALGLPGETDTATVNGWLMEQMNKVPAAGDSLDYGGYKITVTRAEHNRVEECVFVQVAPEAPDDPADDGGA